MTPQPQMNIAKRLWLFLFLPLLVSSILVAMYFSGKPSLSLLIVPIIKGIASDSFREFGLLENLQNLYLFVCIIMAVIAIKTFTVNWQKNLMVLVFLGFVFLFLEEIDYGRHYYDILVKPKELKVVRNIHNINEYNQIFKLIADVATIIWFILISLCFCFIKDSLFKRKFVPGVWYIVPLTVMVLVSKFSKFLDRQGFSPNPDYLLNNLSEFKELGLYYVWMLYMIDIVIWRKNITISEITDKRQH